MVVGDGGELGVVAIIVVGGGVNVGVRIGAGVEEGKVVVTEVEGGGMGVTGGEEQLTSVTIDKIMANKGIMLRTWSVLCRVLKIFSLV